MKRTWRKVEDIDDPYYGVPLIPILAVIGMSAILAFVLYKVGWVIWFLIVWLIKMI